MRRGVSAISLDSFCLFSRDALILRATSDVDSLKYYLNVKDFMISGLQNWLNSSPNELLMSRMNSVYHPSASYDPISTLRPERSMPSRSKVEVTLSVLSLVTISLNYSLRDYSPYTTFTVSSLLPTLLGTGTGSL